jgi:hypothetical protein
MAMYAAHLRDHRQYSAETITGLIDLPKTQPCRGVSL